MTSDQACKFLIPFGKYSGKSLEQVATTDPKGVGYLDWMVSLENLDSEFKQALKCFLSIPWVVQLVEQAAEKHTPRVQTEPVENIQKPRQWWEKR